MTAPDQAPRAADQGAGQPAPAGQAAGVRRRAVLAGGGLVAGAAAASAGWALAGPGSSAPAPGAPAAPGIPPDDDLMREHGVLKRVLLCYREMTRRLQAGQQVAAPDMHDAALIIHDYIEGFHEGLEEGYVFPRLRRAGVLTGTVTTLLVQHARGRVLTQFILAQATAPDIAKASTRTRLAAAMQAFDRMYEPHEAREDTVVFPAFRQIVPAQEFAELGQQFAELEHQQFGGDEFTAMVTRVAGIEQKLGIYDLTQFTPQVTQFTSAM
jgi:hemerythrin-like domain-containing protein